MKLSSEREETALAELEKIVRGDKLGQIFDVLEPRAGKLAKQPTAISFIVLFGALFGLIGIILGFIAYTVYMFPAALIVICTGFLIAAGMSLGHIISNGSDVIRAERKGKAIAGFVEPLLPLLGKTKQTNTMKDITRQLGEGVQAEIERELRTKSKQLPSGGN